MTSVHDGVVIHHYSDSGHISHVPYEIRVNVNEYYGKVKGDTVVIPSSEDNAKYKLEYTPDDAYYAVVPINSGGARKRVHYGTMTKAELVQLCKTRNISGYSNKNKDQLISMLRKR
jgi:hypothetical protein